ncbi:MAG: AMP-binding protein, partial [Methylibium sp.]
MNFVETLASGQPDAWPAARFEAAVDRAAEALRAGGTRVLATLFDNGIAWLVADAGAARAGVVHVPLPGFFTRGQLQHALTAAGVDTLWTVPAAAAGFPGAPSEPLSFDADAEPMAALRLPTVPVAMPAGTAKVTFTSGTTGTPKGVCLGQAAMDRVAQAIGEATAVLGITRHLSVLPFAVLLENIAGVLAPRQRQATCIAVPLISVGLLGSSRF